MGALFSDQIFHKVAYTCREKFTIAEAVEEYFTQCTLIPPGKCRPDTRWEPKVDENALLYPEIPDQPLPVRFIFVLLNTIDNYPEETAGIGRAMGALFSDQIFHKVAYTCREKFTIAEAVEEYFTQCTLIPPGKCRPDTRWEPKVDENA
uniref:Band_3_cyto domain-containing protein n=1 Tax=Bursaphelenchus xylophilus TaxID=6326 RepID=A0A1I7SN70_BURXY